MQRERTKTFLRFLGGGLLCLALTLPYLAAYAWVQYPPSASIGAGDITTSHILNGTILNADISNTASITPDKFASEGTNGVIYFASNHAFATSTNLIFDTSNGRLGVGTTAPARALAVQGDALISGTLTVGTLTATSSISFPAGSVTSAAIADNAVTGADIYAGASTTLATLNVAALTATSSATINNPTLTGTLSAPTNSITSAMLADGAVVNADVSASAGIAYSKLSLANSVVGADIYAGASTTLAHLNTATLYATSSASAAALTVTGAAAVNSLTVTNGATSTNLSVSATASTSALFVDNNTKTRTLEVPGTTKLNNVTYTWPSADGSNQQVLQTNGSATLSWASAGNWRQVASSSCAVACVSVKTDNFATSTNFKIIVSTKGISAGDYVILRFNNDRGANYEMKQEINGVAAADGGNNIGLFCTDYSVTGTAPVYCVVEIDNQPGYVYRFMSKAWQDTGTLSTSKRVETMGFFDVSTTSLQSVTLSTYNGNNLSAGSRVEVYASNN